MQLQRMLLCACVLLSVAPSRDELAPLHSITSSARTSSAGGTARPSALAVYFFTKISSKKSCIAFQDR